MATRTAEIIVNYNRGYSNYGGNYNASTCGGSEMKPCGLYSKNARGAEKCGEYEGKCSKKYIDEECPIKPFHNGIWRKR
jgi:hypothetical protein